MRSTRLVATSLAMTFSLLASSSNIAAEAKKPVALFNGKDLAGWTIFIPHKDKLQPTNTDPKSVFKVEDAVIHVSGEEFGAITTEKSYANYRLKLEVKWGDKKWPPRDQKKTQRDSGVLVHCVGPDKLWTKSIECQIQERDFGDFYLVGGTTIEVDGKLVKDRGVRTYDAEKPHGEWNVVEVLCEGDSITNIINGKVVNAGKKASESKGRILLQSEGAEVFFRNVELTPLGSD